MMSNFPDDEVEFNRCWVATAGSLEAMSQVVVEAESRAAQAFVRRRDEVANALRDLAAELARRRDALSKKVDDFIAEDKKRTYERMRPLRY